ncbi:MAG: NnrU family protein [Candidatus Krumholzibacteriia bacterium]
MLVQLVIFGLILWEPLDWTFPRPALLGWAGLALILVGGWLGTGGLLALGPSLSPFPEPRQGARLVAGGVYARVRHPIYGGLVLGSLGLALWRGSLGGLLLAALLLVFFDRKSRYEERRLETRFPTYADYRRQVGKRLLPWIY